MKKINFDFHRCVKTLSALLLAFAMIFQLSGCRITLDDNSDGAGKPTKVQSGANSENQPEGGAIDENADTPGFSDEYSHVPGIFNFRGGNMRVHPVYGEQKIKKGKMVQAWSNFLAAGESVWGGGAGWTGQPAIVRWPKESRKAMNIKKKFKKKDDFTEVIQASLNGKIYFFDLDTGEATREPLDLGNPIKGSVSIDPRGYPIMLVGQGIDENKKPGFYLINLINMETLLYQKAYDPKSPRHWPGNDSSALFDKDTDTVFMCSENGLVYKIKLNTVFDAKKKELSIDPEMEKYNTVKTSKKFATDKELAGIENSPLAYDNLLFFGDNGGVIRCITTDFEEKWAYRLKDDIDATMVMEIEDGVPYLYAGCEVDTQGTKGTSRIVKLNGLTGEEIWIRKYKCGNRLGASPSNGGLLGTPVLGKGEISDRIIFTLCRYPSFDKGALIALDKKTGKTIYEKELTTYCWPSPVDVYDKKSGKAYIIQNDHDGTTRIFNGKNGKEVFSHKIDYYLEASPAVFNNRVVFSCRSGYMYAMDLK